MVGSELFHHLSQFSDLEVVGTYQSYSCCKTVAKQFYFDCIDFDEITIRNEVVKYDYIINAIMAPINNSVNSDDGSSIQFLINSYFPLWLANAVNGNESVKIINISTDAVFSGKKISGLYDESSFADPTCLYGMSKFFGESANNNVLNIRTSFLGSEPRSHRGLIELVLKCEENCELVGYTDYIWAGVTTKQFSKLIRYIIENDFFYKLRSFSHVLNYTCNEPISKYEIISMIKEIAGRDDIALTPQLNPRGPVNRSIISSCGLLSELNSSQSTLRHSIKEIINEKY